MLNRPFSRICKTESGAVYGESDKSGAYVKDRPVRGELNADRLYCHEGNIRKSLQFEQGSHSMMRRRIGGDGGRRLCLAMLLVGAAAAPPQRRGFQCPITIVVPYTPGTGPA